MTMQPERPLKKLRERLGKKKGGKAKPFVLEWRLADVKMWGEPFWKLLRKWRQFGRYATSAGRDAARAQGARSYRQFEFRVKP